MPIHDGHRERLRKKFKEGNIEDHELLELLLFFSIPRVNTNEIAHRLIEKFGSVNGVFDYPWLNQGRVQLLYNQDC